MTPEQRANLAESFIGLANQLKAVAEEAEDCGLGEIDRLKIKHDSIRYYWMAEKIAKEGK